MLEVSIHYAMGRTIVEQGHPLVPTSDKVRIEWVLPKHPFMLWENYHQAETIKFPKGYGIAYHDSIRDRDLLAPMPFNVLIGWAIWAYQWTRYGAEYWLWRHCPAKVRNAAGKLKSDPNTKGGNK